MRSTIAYLFAALALIAASAVVDAQAPGVESKSSARYDALVFGALKITGIDGLRAEQLVARASKMKPGTIRWLSMMNRARRIHRRAVKRLSKFRHAKMSPALQVRFDREKTEAVARTARAYEALVTAHVIATDRRRALRLLAELRKIAPEEAAKIKTKVLTLAAMNRHAAESDGGPAAHPRTRAGKRLTGEEARWLGRRGYPLGRTTPRGNGGATPPRAPAPRSRAPRPGTGAGAGSGRR